MDKALELKIKYDKNEIVEFREAEKYLDDSELFQKLLTDFEINTINLLWRLTQLSEIPFSGQHQKVKDWLGKLTELTFTGFGFSLTGENDYLLACYNGMITSLLIGLDSQDFDKIEQGINWIVKYQNVRRDKKCNWTGSGIKKYGGCMKSTPCYIGLVKSMISLSDYSQKDSYNKSDLLESKLKAGLEYILNQNIYQRLSDGKPITKDITKITFPFSWKTNIIEILRLLKENQLLKDKRCDLAKDYLIIKRKKDGYWQTQSVYILKNKAWIPFDKLTEKGLWISHEIIKLVENK